MRSRPGMIQPKICMGRYTMHRIFDCRCMNCGLSEIDVEKQRKQRRKEAELRYKARKEIRHG